MPRLPQLLPRHRPGRVKGKPWAIDLSAKIMAQLDEAKGGKREAEHFETKAAAEEYCRDIRLRLASFDDASRRMTGERRLEAHRCFLVCDAHGFNLTDAVEQMRLRVVAQERSILIPKLVDAVIADKQAKGKSEKYLYDSSNRFLRFAKDHQEVKASALTTESLDEWLDTLEVGPVTRNNYRRHLKLLLNFALRKEWVVKNVANGLEKARESTGEVEALTTDECRRLLDHAGNEELPVLAIGLFAGIRPYEIMRMHWSQVHWPEGERPGDIDVLAKQAKTAQRRIVPIRPNFAAWLEPYRDRVGIIYPEGIWHWYRQLSALRKTAKVDRWPSDAMRHSFCSMDLAHFNDANALALRMGHTDTQLIFTRYRRVVKAEEAARFWNLFPSTNP